MKPITWEEALRLNGKPGYTAKDALEAREKELALRREGGVAIRRSWVILERQERICETHGAYESKLEQLSPAPRNPMFKPRWTTCPGCDADIRREQESNAPMSAEMKAVMEKMRLVGASFPERMMDCTLWNYGHQGERVRKGWQKVADYANTILEQVEQGNNLVIHGESRTGKTHLALGVLKHLLTKQGGTGLYITQDRFLSRLKATMNRDNKETEPQVYETLASYDLLVLDEVSKPFSEYDGRQIFRLIDERYMRQCKPILLVSNLSRSALEETLTTAGWLRLTGGKNTLVTVNWAPQ